MNNGKPDTSNFKKFEISDAECKQLFTRAEQALVFAYPRKSYGYAVALLTSKRNMFAGASYTSDSLNLTMHCEAVALTQAAMAGETEIIAITGPNCHTCKQLLWESSIRSKIDPMIIIKEGEGYLRVPLSELMLYPWPDEHLNLQ